MLELNDFTSAKRSGKYKVLEIPGNYPYKVFSVNDEIVFNLSEGGLKTLSYPIYRVRLGYRNIEGKSYIVIHVYSDGIRFVLLPGKSLEENSILWYYLVGTDH